MEKKQDIEVVKVKKDALQMREKKLAETIEKAREEGKSEAWIRLNLDI